MLEKQGVLVVRWYTQWIICLAIFVGSSSLAEAGVGVWDYGNGALCTPQVTFYGDTPEWVARQYTAALVACDPPSYDEYFQYCEPIQISWVGNNAGKSAYTNCYIHRYLSWAGHISLFINPSIVCPNAMDHNTFECVDTPDEYYVKVNPTEEDQCGPSCNGVGDPIDPATGAMYRTERDVGTADGQLVFNRFYNSRNKGVESLSPGWRHSFSRSIRPSYTPFKHGVYTGGSSSSGKYSTPAAACTSGVAAIQSQVSSWSEATPSYNSSNGTCNLVKSGALVATVAVYTTGSRVLAAAPVQYSVTRDSGHVDVFTVDSGLVVAPPDSPLRLTVTPSGFVIKNEADELEYYDSNGRLSSITARTGMTWTLAYGSNDKLLSISDSFGRSIQLGYNDRNGKRIVSVGLSGTTPVTYSYDTKDRLTSITAADTTVHRYAYEDSANPHALTSMFDENNVLHSTWGYAGLGRATNTSEAGGVGATSLSYNSEQSVSVTDAAGAVRVFTFERFVNRWRVVGISGSQCPTCQEGKTTSYDSFGRVTQRTDYNDVVTRYQHDSRLLETSRTEAFGTARARTINTQWHSTFRVPTQIDEPGRQTDYTHDSDGNALTRTVTDLTETPNASRTWTYTYNAFGKVLTADGPRTDVADVTTFTYYTCTTGYQCGQVETITNALGHVTTYNTYNAHGQPLTITDPNGVVTTLAYDARQRLTSRTVGTEQTTFEYWPIGALKKVTLPDSTFLLYTYDAAHRLTDIEDAEGNRIHYTLDAMSNRTTEEVFDSSSALTRTRTQVFNTLNQLWKQIGAAGGAGVTTSFGYDGNGNQTSVAAPLARGTSQTYDELNRLSTVTDPESGLTQYGYDALDQLASVTDPRGLTTSYVYDGLGDLKQQISPDTGTTTNTYDSGGNLKTSTDARAVVTTYTYDALNRVKTAAFKKGTTTDQTITYSYDAGTNGKGRLTGASDSAHSLGWTYDDHGRLLTASQAVGAINKTTSYTYTNGQRATMTTPSGQLVTYGYTNGRLTSINVNGTTVLSNVLYDPFGPARQWSWGNSTLSNRTFDLDGKITQVDSSGLKTYSYDDAFRITGITDTTNSALNWTYGYDDLDRLTSASKTGTTLGYSYDANGNRLTQTGTNASTFTIDPTSNRLTATTGALARSYGFDAAGNTTSYTGITFVYNNRGRMKSSTKNGVTTNYTYNALGQLIKKASTEIYYYDDAGHILGIYNGSGGLKEEIVWLDDIPVATLRPKTGGGVNIFYIHSDHLNTPRLITQPSDNALRWRWDAHPFGGGTSDNNPNGLGAFTFNLRFPGQMYLSETGIYYNYFRDYDQATGRYVQSDPIGLAAGVNTYAHVWGNPLSFVDPFGLDPLNLGDGYTGRLDAFEYQGDASFEIHVYDKNGKEVGVFGPKGWINKHGFDGPPKGVPENVCATIKGVTIEELRKRNRFPPKGTVNIKGDKWKFFVKFGGAASVIGNINSNLSIERLCGMDPEHPACGGQ